MNSLLTETSPWRLIVASVAVIALVALAGYINTFSVPMIFDDYTSIVANSAVINFDIAQIWSHHSTRFVVYLSLAVNYAISGLNVWSYHLANLFIHIATALVVGWLAVLLSARTYMTRYYKIGSFEVSNHWIFAIITALLFVSHPIQTQAVTYTIQRLTSFAALFYILGLSLYVQGRGEGSSRWWFVGSGLAVLIAMFSKEIAFTAPLTILLIEFLFLGQKQPIKKRLIRVLPILLALLIIPSVMFVTRTISSSEIINPNGVMIGSLDKIDFKRIAKGLASDETEITRGKYFLTELNVVRTYLRLLVWPTNQNLDYDYSIETGVSKSTALSGVIITIILVLGVILIRYNRLAAFGILFFFLALLIESSIIPISDVIFEHRLYLPSIGFFMAISSGIVFITESWAIKSKIRFYTGILLIGCVIIIATVATFKRNIIWQNEETLWLDVVTKSPNKARAHGNLAAFYLHTNELDEAFKELQIAKELQSDLPGLHYNLGNYYVKKGDLYAAGKEYKKEFAVDPHNINVKINGAGVSLKKGNNEIAKTRLEAVTKSNPDIAYVWANLGLAYLQLDEKQNASKAFLRALEIDPNLESAKQGLQIMLNK
jgi:protein O-mannosyl-transferase